MPPSSVVVAIAATRWLVVVVAVLPAAGVKTIPFHTSTCAVHRRRCSHHHQSVSWRERTCSCQGTTSFMESARMLLRQGTTSFFHRRLWAKLCARSEPGSAARMPHRALRHAARRHQHLIQAHARRAAGACGADQGESVVVGGGKRGLKCVCGPRSYRPHREWRIL